MLKEYNKTFNIYQYMTFYPDYPATYDVNNYLYLPSSLLGIS